MGQAGTDPQLSAHQAGRYETWRSSLLLPSGVVLTQHGLGLVLAQGCYTRNFLQKKGTAVVILLVTAALCLPLLCRGPRVPSLPGLLLPGFLLLVWVKKNPLGCGFFPTLPSMAFSHNVVCPLFCLGVEPAQSSREARARTGPLGLGVGVTTWLHGEW